MTNGAERNTVKELAKELTIKLLEAILIISAVIFVSAFIMYVLTSNEQNCNIAAIAGTITIATLVLGLHIVD